MECQRLFHQESKWFLTLHPSCHNLTYLFRKSASSLWKASSQKDRKSANSSLGRDITTPDKFIPTYQKNSSSNKKSTVKSFRPQDIQIRGVKQFGISDSSQKKRLKLRSKNPDDKGKLPLKLDFNMKSMSNVTIMTTKPINKKISVQSKLSNNIPKAPSAKRNQLSGTFCQSNYQEQPRLSSRNNAATYSGIHKAMDEGKHNNSHYEVMKPKENLIHKGMYNWVVKPVTSNSENKVNKNYRSMTSLINRPGTTRNFSSQRSRYSQKPSNPNDSSSFVSKHEIQPSNIRKNVFQQIQNLTRRDSTTKVKNASITRRYLCRNIKK